MIALIAATLGGDDGSGGSGGGSTPAGQAKQGQGKAQTPKSYEVQSGDTLTSIAHENGVSVARILRLNPGVDPQILICRRTAEAAVKRDRLAALLAVVFASSAGGAAGGPPPRKL